jgi:hypothetical protein
MTDHIGSSLDDFLDEEGLLAETEAVAIRRVIALRLEQAMGLEGLSKADLARRIGTNRSVLDRLRRPDNPSVSKRPLPP